MSDPVLTDEEKGALLDGMSSGEVEVHSASGKTYAAVKPFEVGPRSRIVTNSYPRLQSLNRQFASRADKVIENLLNAECSVTFNHVANMTFSEFAETRDGLSLLLEFQMQPLEGVARVAVGGRALGLAQPQGGLIGLESFGSLQEPGGETVTGIDPVGVGFQRIHL